MQTWDAWGGAWGDSWGYAWGYAEETAAGGGPGNAKKRGKGWANERAAFEASLRPQEAQAVLRQTADRQATRIASKINAYDIGKIDLDALRIENESLKARLRIKEEYTQTLQAAQEVMAAFIEDEQDALDTLMADFEMDVTLILQQH